MMFNTDKFVREIRSRECIWNPQVTEYSSKISRKKAWKEIGRAMNPEWSTTFSAEDRYKTTTDYMKKWKNLKDYYYRCKYRGIRGQKKTPGYFPELSFLDAIKASKEAATNITSTDNTENTEDSNDSEDPLNADEVDTYETENNTSDFESSFSTMNQAIKDEFDDCIIHSIQNIAHSTQKGPTRRVSALQNNQRHAEHDDEENATKFSSNKHFLLSLLADMDRMTEEQNLDFRLSILKVVRNIKYNVK